MFFNKKDYLSLIKSLQFINTLISILWIFSFSIAGYHLSFLINSSNIIGLFIGLIIGLLTDFPIYTISQIKIQEMYMKIDIYNKIIYTDTKLS